VRRLKRRLIETKNADAAKIRVIHNWSDAYAIQPASKDNAFAREHGLVDKFVVMHSGNVGLSQDVDALIDVAERLTDLTDVVVAIVGEGSRKKFLQEEVSRRQLANVRFFPYQPKARLTDSFATTDVFIVSLKRGLAGFIVPVSCMEFSSPGAPLSPLSRRTRRLPKSRETTTAVLLSNQAIAAGSNRPFDGSTPTPGCDDDWARMPARRA